MSPRGTMIFRTARFAKSSAFSSSSAWLRERTPLLKLNPRIMRSSSSLCAAVSSGTLPSPKPRTMRFAVPLRSQMIG